MAAQDAQRPCPQRARSLGFLARTIEKDLGDRAHLFNDLFTVYAGAEQTENSFNFFTCVGPRGEIIPAHMHADTYEVFFVTDDPPWLRPMTWKQPSRWPRPS